MVEITSFLTKYVEYGWHLLPLNGKKPLLAHGFKDASNEFAQILRWREEFPGCNWGIATAASGLIVLDIDAQRDGYETWDFLRELSGWPSIQTPTVLTGSGGQHLYFNQNGLHVKSGNDLIGNGIDIKASSGYIVVPPSIHPNGTPYEWILSPEEIGLDPFPDWLMHIIQDVDKPHVKSQNDGKILSGTRNSTLTSLAGTMRRRGMTQPAIEAALYVENNERCAPPLPGLEVNKIAFSVAKYEPAITTSQHHNTDLGNARRLVELHGDDIRFCKDWNTWIFWDGKRWKKDNSGEIERRVHFTIRSMHEEISRIENPDERTYLARWAFNSESRGHIKAMADLARSLVPICQEELDLDPMLLNVKNGTIDLRTGVIRNHSREDLTTKLITIDYEPGKECPKWIDFLKLVTGIDEELMRFIQLAVGYTLSGRTDEHCIFFLYGDGQNGKTTFTETIRHIFGDYAHRTDVEALLLTQGRGQGASPYTAALAGARYVLASEIPENRKFNESLIKDLTGGDTVTARFLYGNPFTFKPRFKLWFAGNHKPNVVGTDYGFWRRINVIPFVVTIPESICRPMHDLLEEFKSEAPGILSWAVEGCLEWIRTGLITPTSVENATQEYKSEQDLILQYIEECCDTNINHEVFKDTLFQHFKNWSDSNNFKEMARKSKSWFTRQMIKHGFEHSGDGRRKLRGLKPI